MESFSIKNLRSLFPALGSKIKEIETCFSPSTYPPRTILLKEGEIAAHLYVIVKGSMRTFLIKEDGQEITTQFFFEGQMIASMQSFFTGTPSRCYLETIEQTQVLTLPKQLFDEFMMDDSVKDMLISFLKTRLFHYQNLHTSYILDAPEKRYLNLISERPDIMERIPHYDIASFLGITPVSLSRIRSRLKKRAAINKG